MAVGTEAKKVITDKLKDCFGTDFLGEDGGKIYLNSKENGEVKVVAVSMTCPKIVPTFGKVPVAKVNSDDVPPWETPIGSTEVTAEEQENLQKLMERLGL